jgi:hypothetical protein
MSATTNESAGGRPAGDGPFARLGRDLDNFLRSCIPSEEVSQHFSNARVEVLRGLRAMIDARIDRLSANRRKGVSIPVE